MTSHPCAAGTPLAPPASLPSTHAPLSDRAAACCGGEYRRAQIEVGRINRIKLAYANFAETWLMSARLMTQTVMGPGAP